MIAHHSLSWVTSTPNQRSCTHLNSLNSSPHLTSHSPDHHPPTELGTNLTLSSQGPVVPRHSVTLWGAVWGVGTRGMVDFKGREKVTKWWSNTVSLDTKKASSTRFSSLSSTLSVPLPPNEHEPFLTTLINSSLTSGRISAPFKTAPVSHS